MSVVSQVASFLPDCAGLTEELGFVYTRALVDHAERTRREIPFVNVSIHPPQSAESAQALDQQLSELVQRFEELSRDFAAGGIEPLEQWEPALAELYWYRALGGLNFSYTMGLSLAKKLETLFAIESERAKYPGGLVPEEQAERMLGEGFRALAGLTELSGKVSAADRMRQFSFFALDDNAFAICDEAAQFLRESELQPLVEAERERAKFRAGLGTIAQELFALFESCMAALQPTYVHRRDAANLGVESLDSLPHAWLRRGDEVLVRTVWRAAQDGSLELVISLHQGHALWNGGKSDLASLVRDLRTQLQERTSEVTSATDLLRGPIEDKDHHSSVRKFSVNFVIPFNCSAVGFSNEGLPGGEEGLVFVKRS